MKEKIIILGSGIALGVYVPPLLFTNKLIYKNFNVQFEVLESLFLEKIHIKILNNKKMFHSNVRIAVKGHQKVSNYEDYYDKEKLQNLFIQWQTNNCFRFIVFSGFWIPVLKKYETQISQKIIIDCVHMDAIISNSWNRYKDNIKDYHNIWLYSWEKNLINYTISLKDIYAIKQFNERLPYVTIHGGGWGMGIFNSKITELNSNHIHLNRILYYPDEEILEQTKNSYFLLNNEWIPWEKNINNQYSFPEMSKWNPIQKCWERYGEKNQDSFLEILNNSMAIISKPGGGTLLDSFETETPIIFLDPVGKYEKQNANLWITKGFGYDYEVWKENNFSQNMLYDAHYKIKEYKNHTMEMENVLCSLKQI